MKFYIVDAFTETLFGGNPAGVVLLGDAAFPPEDVMLKTAAELRYSETAFLRRTGENACHTRYFTPEAEVDLCGHATIGAFCALADAGQAPAGATLQNRTAAGLLEVVVEGGAVWMETAAPQWMGAVEGAEALAELYGVMGLTYGAARDGDLLPALVSTGLPDIMLPVADEAALAAIRPDFGALAELSKRYEVVGVHAFVRRGADGNPHCRNFAPLYAIDEEAATGTSNSALTYYLYHSGLLQSGAETCFIQGEAMGRPSAVRTRLTVAGDKVDIRVGGAAAVLAKGEILL